MTTAAVYLRVSTEDQAKRYSLDAQRDACSRRARELGAAVIQEFVDPGVSGEVLERPGLTALRDAVAARQVQLVIALDPDRLARKLGLQIALTEEMEQAGVRLDFVDFEWKSTEEGQLYYHMRGAFAQYEKAKIKRRTAYGRRQKAKRGQLPLRFQPYGYRFDSVHDTLQVAAEEAAVVQDMYRWLLDEGLGPHAIAARLEALGAPTPAGGKRWYRSSVARMLRNPVYKGMFLANRYDCTGMGLNRHLSPERRARPKIRPEAEWIPIPVAAIVEPALWERAQRLLGQARRLWAGKARHAYLLSGQVVCGHCDGPMHGCKTHRRYYTCRSTDGARRYGCAHWAPAERLEDLVWKIAWDAIYDPDALVAAYGEVEGSGQRQRVQAELHKLEAALAKKERARQAFLLVLARGEMEPEEGVASLVALNAEAGALQAQCAQLEGMRSAHNATPEAESVVRQAGARLEAALTEEERRLLLRRIVARVVVERGRVELMLRTAPQGPPG